MHTQRTFHACVDELRRLKSGNEALRNLLTAMSYRSTLPLLDLILREQIEASMVADERLDWVFQHLSVLSEAVEDPGLQAVIEDARRAFDEAHLPLRDMKMVHAAVKVQHYFLGAYTGMGVWLHQVGRHRAADVVEELVERLRIAERHLEDVRSEVGFGERHRVVELRTNRRLTEYDGLGQLGGSGRVDR